MPRMILSWTMVVLAGATGPVVAGPLTLDEAIRNALVHNPQLRIADAQSAEADARAKAARGAYLPQLGIHYLARRSDNPLDAFADKLNTRSVDAADLDPATINQPGTSSLRATQVRLEMPIYTGGRIRAGAREARARADSADRSLAFMRQTIAYRTIEAYRQLQAAERAVQITNDAVAAAHDHVETTSRLVRQGRIVVSDRLTAELNQASVESAREQAEGRWRQAREDFRTIAGLPTDADIVLPPWENSIALPAPDGNTEDRALAQRRDLQAHESRILAAEARVKAARAAFAPQIGLVATDTWYDDNASLDNKSQAIMGVVSVNLFNGGRDWHGFQAARQDLEQAEARRDDLRSSVRRDVRLAKSRLTEALARQRIAREGVDKAREAVRLIRQRYGEGRTILIDLLMAERLLVEARQEELNASTAAVISAAGLQLADGSLPLPGDAVSTPATGR